MKYFLTDVVETAKKQFERKAKEEMNIFDSMPIQQKKVYEFKFKTGSKVMKDHHLFLGDVAIHEKGAFIQQFITDSVITEMMKLQPFKFHFGKFVEEATIDVKADIAKLCSQSQQQSDSFNRKISDLAAKIASIDTFLKEITKTMCELRDEIEKKAPAPAPVPAPVPV